MMDSLCIFHTLYSEMGHYQLELGHCWKCFHQGQWQTEADEGFLSVCELVTKHLKHTAGLKGSLHCSRQQALSPRHT